MWWVVGVVVSTVWCQWVRCIHLFPFLQGNYKIYRDKLGTTELPAVPYVGVFLKDLTFICDGNPDYLRGGLINIHKRRQVRKEWWGLRGGGGYQHSQEEAGKEGVVGFEGGGGVINIHKRRQVRKEWWGLRGGGGGYQHSQEEAGKEGVVGFEGRGGGGYQHSQEEAGKEGVVGFEGRGGGLSTFTRGGR